MKIQGQIRICERWDYFVRIRGNIPGPRTLAVISPVSFRMINEGKTNEI